MKTKTLIISVVLLSTISFSQVKTDPESILINDYASFISVNEILMWLGNNGMGSHNPSTDGSGFYWPGGDQGTLTAVFSDGLVWGGIVNGQTNVNGDTYRYGLQAGSILSNGVPDNPNDNRNRVYKILNGWENLPPGPIRDRYQLDYLEWPGNFGAPFKDVDNNGFFTPGLDLPSYVGDETLWYVANDLDDSRTTFTYGSPPIGLEFQTTTFAFDQANFLADAVFKKYRIINKSSSTIENMYLAYWMDDDLGNSEDDYSGCDTLLNLGYTYNADNDDEGQSGYGANPPAVGHLLLQGPIVPSALQDSALFNNEWRKGYRNIPMTTFSFYINNSPLYRDPVLGTYDGTIQFYNIMNGVLWNGLPFVDPNIGVETKFPLAGDPVNGSGWYEGAGWPGGPIPGDRRSLISSGPFVMQPADTQEVVVAIFMARGSSNLNSVAELKNKAGLLREFYFNQISTSIDDNNIEMIDNFELYQNFPNPFNPLTKIKYSIHQTSQVQIKVFDILGNEIETLVNEEKPAGTYEITWNAANLPSGVYFYQLKAGDFVQTKKMILMK